MGSKGMLAIIIVIVIFAVINIILISTGSLEFGDGQWAKSLGVIVAAGLTLAMYSFLYQDNAIFKVAEHLYVGISVGYIIIQTYYTNLLPNLIKPLILADTEKTLLGRGLLVIPAFFGVLMLSRFIPKYAWLSRWAIAFIVGMGAGMAIPRVLKTYIFAQAKSAIAPLSATAMFSGDGGFWGVVNAWSPILALVGVICVLIHFLFSVEHKGPVRVASRTGITFLMIAFGAGFGYTVMARMSLLIGRITFLLKNWLHIID